MHKLLSQAATNHAAGVVLHTRHLHLPTAGRAADWEVAGNRTAFVETALSARLQQEIFAGERKLIFISAPGGFGKTAILNQLHRAAEARRIRTVHICCKQAAALHASTRSLLTARDHGEQSLVLIDDAHENPALVTPEQLMSWAQSHSRTRYVVAARSLPDLDWLSLTFASRVLLLRMEDLQLRRNDIQSFLEHYALRPVSAATVAEVVELSEGWPLAVQLCGLRVRTHADWSRQVKEALCLEAGLAAHFEHAVFGALDAPLRRFLRAVAPLDRFSAAQCAEILELPEVPACFAAAVRMNLFLLPTDESGWYRLHGLFRTFLNQYGGSQVGAEANGVLRKARDWCVREGRNGDAVEYSLRIGEFVAARQILLVEAPRLVCERGQLPQIIRWIDLIERGLGQASPRLQLWKVWALVFSMRLADARHELGELEAMAGFADMLTSEPYAAMHVDQLRCSIAVREDAISEARERALAWLDRYKSAPPFYRAVILGSLTLSSFATAHENEHSRYLDLAKRAAAEACSDYADAWLSAVEISIELVTGHVQTARRLAEESVATAQAAMGEAAPIVSSLSLLAARAACEEGRLEEAEGHLARGLVHFGDHGLVEIAIAGLEAVAYTTEAKEGGAAAVAEVRHHMCRGIRFAPRFEIESAHLIVMLLLRAGDVCSARQELQMRVIPAVAAAATLQADEHVRLALHNSSEYVRAALLLAEQKFADVVEICNRLLPQAEARGRMRRLVELRILKAAALRGQGNQIMAAKIFARALAVAAGRGYVQTLCDLHWAVRPFLGGADLPETGQAFVQEIQRRLSISSAGMGGAAAHSSLTGLTEREIEILRLLDSGLKNQAVAQTLKLSLATVKWHIQNIYTKLDVSNRSGALSTARRCGLLYQTLCHA